MPKKFRARRSHARHSSACKKTDRSNKAMTARSQAASQSRMPAANGVAQDSSQCDCLYELHRRPSEQAKASRLPM